MKVIVAFLGVSVILVGLACLMALPVMWLVNGLLSQPLLMYLFGTPQIDFVQALYLSLLCSLLFKGSGSSSSSE